MSYKCNPSTRGRRCGRPHAKLQQLCGLGLSLLLGLPGVASASFDTDGDHIADEIDTYPCDPSVSGTGFAPAQGDHGMLLFEDQWPAQGDFDFNDVAVSYNYVFRMDKHGKVTSFRVTFNPLAVGGKLHNGLGLRLPIPATEIRRATRTVAGQITQLTPSAIDADATFVVSEDLRELFSAVSNEIINADPTLPRQVGEPIDLEIELTDSRYLDLPSAPYDVFIFRTDDPTLEVHLPDYRGTARFDTSRFNTQDDQSFGGRNFVDTRLIPFALHFPTVVAYPLEGTPIDQLYPNIVLFGQSGGSLHQDFYTSNIDAQHAYRDSANQAAPEPRFVSTTDMPADTSCVPAWGLAVQWGDRRSHFTYGAATAPNGDALLTGYTSGNFPNSTSAGGLDGFVARHDLQTGAGIWVAQLGTAGDDAGHDVTVDIAGNVYVAGVSSNVVTASVATGPLGGVTDAFVSKLDGNGNVLWTTNLGGLGNDAAHGVEVDDHGFIYVAGSATDVMVGAVDPGGQPSSFLAKLDPNGQVVWLQQYRTDPAHPANYSTNHDLALDKAAGALYVVGTERRYNRNPSAATNPVVTKHRLNDGAMLWAKHVGDYGYWDGCISGRFGYGFAVDVDDFDGSVYMTGSFVTGAAVSAWGSWSRAAFDGSPDAYFTKVTPSGQVAWSHSLASNGHGPEYAESVHASGAGGNVYFTGRTEGTLPGQTALGGGDYYMAAFGHDGVPRWTVQGGTAHWDMGHFAATTHNSQSGGVLYTIGNSDAAEGIGRASWRTNFYRHDVVDGSLQSVTPAQHVDWQASPWGACSNTCGEGTKTRTVTCLFPDGTQAPDSECLTARPPETAVCSDFATCSGSWQMDPWSACSATCGVGERTRFVQCEDNMGTAQPEAACGGFAPPRSESCSSYATCTYSWNSGDWSQCQQPASCELGTKTRTVFCMRSDGTEVPDQLCSGVRPSGQRSCTDGLCSASNVSCATLLASGTTTSGRYDVDPDGPGPASAVNVYCDMDSFGGGWTNLDFVNNRVWLDVAHYIECGAGLEKDDTSVTCRRPRFDGQESLPLYQFRCDGQDRSVDYVLEHVAPHLGHNGALVLGFASLSTGQIMGGGASTGGHEFCYAHGTLARYDHLACAEYRVEGQNQQCVPGFFTLRL